MKSKALLSIRLRHERGGEEGEVAFVQFMEWTGPPDIVEENVGCTCEIWSSSYRMDHNVCLKALEGRNMNVGKW